MVEFINIPDEVLQAEAVAGDRIAEEALVERYTRLVRICARPYFLAGGDSEDLTQEGLLGLISAIREYDPGMNAKFKTFAEQCIKNRLVSAVRSASRKKHIPLNEGLSLDEVLSFEAQTSATLFPEAFRRVPEEQVLARESADEFFGTFSKCLSRLESDVLMLYLDGLSYQEMADRFNKTPKSVDNAVQRIRQKLANHPKRGDYS